MRVKQARWVAMALAAIAAALPACGGGGNDQGIVFRATGIFRGLEQIEEGKITCTEPNVSNALVDTSYTLDVTSVEYFPKRDNPIANPCGGYLALQNNLDFQSINVQEIEIRYEVPGASIPVPDNPVSTGQTILPATSTASTASEQANLIYLRLLGEIVSEVTMTFLNQNVNRLPGYPYTMNVFISATGQSDDGTIYATNEVGYTLTITDSLF